jgi:integrase
VVQGFGLRVTWGGTKSFFWEGRINGRPRRITIGAFPDLSVLLARQKAIEIKASIARGGNPVEQRKEVRREITFGDLAASYLELYAKPHRKSWKRDRDRLTVHFGRWNTRKLSEVTAQDIARAHSGIGKEHGTVAANRAVSLLRAMFNWGLDQKLFKSENPAARIKQFTERPRERYLSLEELTRVNQAVMDEQNIYWKAFFPLALMLGPRRSELLAARWENIELDAKTWWIPDTKSGQPHLLPLPDAAIALLKPLPSRHDSDFVFPGEGATGHLVEVKTAWDRIRKRAGIPDVRLHDLRRTLGSMLASQGAGLLLIAKALNHRSTRATEIYSKLDLAALREALERNAQLITVRPSQPGSDDF